MQMASLYFYGDRVWMAPKSGGGALWETEPVLNVIPRVSDVSVALDECLAKSKIPAPIPDLRRYTSPVFAAIGIGKTSKAADDFHRRSRHCTVFRSNEKVEVQKWRRAKRGLEPDGAPTVLAVDAPTTAIAEKCLEVLTPVVAQ
jgi:hypothetical protein